MKEMLDKILGTSFFAAIGIIFFLACYIPYYAFLQGNFIAAISCLLFPLIFIMGVCRLFIKVLEDEK